MSEYTLEFIAEKLGLTLKGESFTVRGINTLEAAASDEISFLANPKYAKYLSGTKAGAVIVDAAHASAVKCALISDAPYRDFGRALAFFERKEGCLTGIQPNSYIDPSASLGEGCTVYPFAFIGARVKAGKNCTFFPGSYIGEDAIIGDNCQIYPNAVVLSKVQMGNNCLLHPGVVLGAEGFGFTRVPDGIFKIPQIGYTKLEDRVEVGANATVDRGALGPTIIGKQTKIDNIVQVGHNAEIGEENLIVAQTGIAGSTKSGKRVTFAAQCGTAGHIYIGDDVIMGARAGVMQDVPAGFIGSGTPLMDRQTYLRNVSLTPKLPDMYKRFTKLEKELAELKAVLLNDKEQN